MTVDALSHDNAANMKDELLQEIICLKAIMKGLAAICSDNRTILRENNALMKKIEHAQKDLSVQMSLTFLTQKPGFKVLEK